MNPSAFSVVRRGSFDGLPARDRSQLSLVSPAANGPRRAGCCGGSGPEGGLNDNGNLTNDGVRSYTYDHANRLTQVTEGSLTTQFAYNGDGARTSKTVSGDTTEYVLDLAATLPVVISDTEEVYLYGLDIIAQQQAERLYYMHDGLGSVRQLVDTTGQIETNYAYDPFGVPMMGGDVYNPYQFTGEAWDADVELLYLRARYYQPEVGRFVTKDPWAGDVWRPGTLNGYLYVVDNPVNRADPAGLQCEGCPSPSPVPTPEPFDIGDRRRSQLADELARDYGIQVLSSSILPVFRISALADWRLGQLYLVKEAAREFADLMQGKEATFRTRIRNVGLYKAAGKLVFLTERGAGLASPSGTIRLSGAYWLEGGGAFMKGVIVHELAHVWDFRTGGRLSAEMVATGFWRRIECRTPAEPQRGPEMYRLYDWNRENRKRPNMNPVEDWADSVFAYVYPKYAKAISRSKWSYVGQQMDPYNWGNYHFYPSEWRSKSFKSYSVKAGEILPGRE